MTLRDAILLGFDTKVYEVEAGTMIEHEGKKLGPVTDTAIVWLGNRCFCTTKIYQQIKQLSAKRMS